MSSFETPTSAPDGIFSPDETEALERDSIFLPGSPVTGKRRVSTAFLRSPAGRATDISSSSVRSTASVQFISENRVASDSFELPTDPISIEALEFIGFTMPTATAIYNTYVPELSSVTNRYGLLEHVYEHILLPNTDAYLDMSSNQALDAIGLNAETQAALLDPCFSSMLWTEDLDYWVRDTLRLRYLSLLHLQDRLKAHATLRALQHSI